MSIQAVIYFFPTFPGHVSIMLRDPAHPTQTNSVFHTVNQEDLTDLQEITPEKKALRSKPIKKYEEPIENYLQLSNEKAIYGNPWAIELPILEKDYKKTVKELTEWLENNIPKDYSLFTANCAHATAKILGKIGYLELNKKPWFKEQYYCFNPETKEYDIPANFGPKSFLLTPLKVAKNFFNSVDTKTEAMDYHVKELIQHIKAVNANPKLKPISIQTSTQLQELTDKLQTHIKELKEKQKELRASGFNSYQEQEKSFAIYSKKCVEEINKPENQEALKEFSLREKSSPYYLFKIVMSVLELGIFYVLACVPNKKGAADQYTFFHPGTAEAYLKEITKLASEKNEKPHP